MSPGRLKNARLDPLTIMLLPEATYFHASPSKTSTSAGFTKTLTNHTWQFFFLKALRAGKLKRLNECEH